MKSLHRKLALSIAGTLLSLAAQAADVGVSVSIGQPGFYGQLDIGGFPTPRLIYPEPVIVSPGVYLGGPVYLRVPPGHRRNWVRYCGQYGACGQRVYFVRDDWYTREYAPRYVARHTTYVERRDYDDRHDYGDHHEGRGGREGGGPPWGGNGEGHGHGHGYGHSHGHGHGQDRD